jgi:hypothetical protein
MTALVVGGALCALLAAATLRVLRAPLLALLIELCAGTERAHFWWRVFGVEMLTGTAICTSLATLGRARGDSWWSVASMARGGCVGLIVSLAVMTVGVLAFQRDRDRGRRQP